MLDLPSSSQQYPRQYPQSSLGAACALHLPQCSPGPPAWRNKYLKPRPLLWTLPDAALYLHSPCQHCGRVLSAAPPNPMPSSPGLVREAHEPMGPQIPKHMHGFLSGGAQPLQAPCPGISGTRQACRQAVGVSWETLSQAPAPWGSAPSLNKAPALPDQMSPCGRKMFVRWALL